MNIVSIADEIWRELDMPDDISIPVVAFWIRSNIGTLNNLLNLDLSIDEDGEITPELTLDEKSIYKTCYLIYYYGKLAKSNMGANSYEIQEVTEGDTRVKMAVKTDKAKIYLSVQKDMKSDLDKMVKLYRYNNAIPSDAVTSEAYGAI